MPSLTVYLGSVIAGFAPFHIFSLILYQIFIEISNPCVCEIKNIFYWNEEGHQVFLVTFRICKWLYSVTQRECPLRMLHDLHQEMVYPNHLTRLEKGQHQDSLEPPLLLH